MSKSKFQRSLRVEHLESRIVMDAALATAVAPVAGPHVRVFDGLTTPLQNSTSLEAGPQSRYTADYAESIDAVFAETSRDSGSSHAGGLNFLLGDGSVRFI